MSIRFVKRYALEIIVLLISIGLYLLSNVFELGLTVVLIIINLAVILFGFIKEIINKREVDEHYAESRFTNEKIQQIESYISNERSGLVEKQTILKLLIKNGVVDEKDVFDNLKQQSFISLFCYQRRLPDELKEVYGPQRPVLSVIESVGFSRLGKMHNFYVIPSSYLPAELQEVTKIEAYMKFRIKKEWKALMKTAKKDYNEIYEKYKDDEKVFNFSYFITKSFFPNLAIGFINYCCFNKRFVEEYSKFVKLSKIKINKSKIEEFMKMLTVDLLIEELPSNDRELIDIRKLKKQFKVKTFADYATLSVNDLKKYLMSLFDEEKATLYSAHMIAKAQKYVAVLRETGVV